MFNAIKRNATDALFSEIVRRRAKWTCEKCHRGFEFSKHILDCSHFWSRKNRRVRFDFDNVASICRGCHIYFGNYPGDHAAFFLKRLGQERYDALEFRAKNIGPKVDELMLRKAFKLEIKEMDKKDKEGVFGAR